MIPLLNKAITANIVYNVRKDYLTVNLRHNIITSCNCMIIFIINIVNRGVTVTIFATFPPYICMKIQGLNMVQ